MTITVIDWQGKERDLDYLHFKYGPFVITPIEGPGWKIWKLVERADGDFDPAVLLKQEDKWVAPRADASLIVGAEPGVTVAWAWPGGQVVGVTNAEGIVGFAMGRGAYYWPGKGEKGPHSFWIVDEPSDRFDGAGMVAATNHYHIDAYYARQEGDDEMETGFYDVNGNPKDEVWADQQFGAQEISDPGTESCYEVVELHEAQGDHRMCSARVLNLDGEPTAGVRVRLAPRDVSGDIRTQATDDDGYATFPLAGLQEHSAIDGQGHYVIGVMDGHSQVYNSVGVVMRSKPPRWLNPVFQLAKIDEPPDDDECPRTEILECLLVLSDAMDAFVRTFDAEMDKLQELLDGEE